MQQPQQQPPNYNLQYPVPQAFNMNSQQYQMPPYQQQPPLQKFPQVEYEKSVNYQLPPPPSLYQQQVLQGTYNNLSQPQLPSSTQLQQKQFSKNYINPLCGCTKECGICLISWCIPCAFQYFHADAVETATGGKTSFVAGCCLECCCCCCINRLAIRQAYNIDGNFLSDCCLMVFCRFCASLQDTYEVKSRE